MPGHWSANPGRELPAGELSVPQPIIAWRWLLDSQVVIAAIRSTSSSLAFGTLSPHNGLAIDFLSSISDNAPLFRFAVTSNRLSIFQHGAPAARLIWAKYAGRQDANNSNMTVRPELRGYPDPSRGTTARTRLSDCTFCLQQPQAEKDASKIVQKCTKAPRQPNWERPQQRAELTETY